jgi:hypothetical protein
MPKAQVVHQRAGCNDRLTGRIEAPREALEAADPYQAVRLDLGIGRVVKDCPAVDEREVNRLGPPQRRGNDVV